MTTTTQSLDPLSSKGSLSDMTNMEIVILALYTLGGDQGRIDTEDVAIRANELGPGRFTWSKYPQQISIEHVRVFLSDAKKMKNGGLAVGNGTEGWSLTSTGVAWASNHSAALVTTAQVRQRLDKTSERRRRHELARIKELPAWARHTTGETISQRDAEAVFRVSSYSPASRRRELIERIKGLFVHDREVATFLSAMAKILFNEEEN